MYLSFCFFCFLSGKEKKMNSCLICSTKFYHFGNQAVTLGCQCVDKPCQKCVSDGKIVMCPICKKKPKKPIVCNDILTRIKDDVYRVDNCLGCRKPFTISNLSKHEESCIEYVRLLKCNADEEKGVYAKQYETSRKEVHELEKENDLKDYEIETLNEQCRHYEIMVASYDEAISSLVKREHQRKKDLCFLLKQMDVMEKRMELMKKYTTTLLQECDQWRDRNVPLLTSRKRQNYFNAVAYVIHEEINNRDDDEDEEEEEKEASDSSSEEDEEEEKKEDKEEKEETKTSPEEITSTS